jgi:hypothetical protein
MLEYCGIIEPRATQICAFPISEHDVCGMRADSGELQIIGLDRTDSAEAAGPYCRHPWLLYSPSTVLV